MIITYESYSYTDSDYERCYGAPNILKRCAVEELIALNTSEFSLVSQITSKIFHASALVMSVYK